MSKLKLKILLILIMLTEFCVFSFVFFVVIPNHIQNDEEMNMWLMLFIVVFILFSNMFLNVKFYEIFEKIFYEKKNEFEV